MIRVLLALSIAFAPHAAFAIPPQHCGVRQNVVQYQQAQAVQTYVHNGQYLQLQQVYPYAFYSVGAAIQEEAVAARIAKLVEKKLQAAAMANQPGPAPAPAYVHPGATLATQRCSGCHKAGAKAVADDGAPILFDPAGKWIGTRDQASAAVTAMRLGSMPPVKSGKELETEEFITVQAYLNTLWPKEPIK